MNEATQPLTEEQLAKLKWTCRRGMLELDVLLQRFLKSHFEQMSTQDQVLFIDMLALPDPELYSALMGYEAISDVRFESMIERIKQASA